MMVETVFQHKLLVNNYYRLKIRQVCGEDIEIFAWFEKTFIPVTLLDLAFVF